MSDRLGYRVHGGLPKGVTPPKVVVPWLIDVSKPIGLTFLILCNMLFVVAWDDTATVAAAIAGALGFLGVLHLNGTSEDIKVWAKPYIRIAAYVNLAAFGCLILVVILALLGLT